MLDLLTLVSTASPLRKVALTDGGEWAGACPWCGGDDRFRVWPEAERPHYWCRGCQRQGDRIQWLRDHDGLSYPEAAHAAGHPVSTGAAPAHPTRQAADAAPPAVAWQERARVVVQEAAAALWSPVGARALGYLQEQRGLSAATIRAAQLGYLPAERYEPPAAWGLDGERHVWLPAGLVIPCEAQGALWYAKIRRPSGEPKYIAPRGWRPALYGADTLAGRPLLVLTEGELDALLLRQAAGDLIDVATLGSASQRLSGRWLSCLLPAQRVLAVYDQDMAGQRGAAALAALSARVRRVRPLDGKDLTEQWQRGGDLRAWAEYQCARHGPPPEAPTQPVPSWDAAAGRLLIGALYRRVAAAWNPLPPAERPKAAYQALAPLDRGLWAAYERRDLDAVRQAVANYEAAAEPIFAAWRASRQHQEAA
jgi:DNA primase